jgi:hypothetical protein
MTDTLRARPRQIARAVTRGPGHHSFGYYDKSPWDRSSRYLLALQAPFCHRSPEAEDVATLGLVDLADGERFLPFAETRAWNWQQGCMLQWLPPADHQVIFNDRDGDEFVAVICDPFTGKVMRRLPRPIYAVNHAGTEGLSLNFSRLHVERPGYGYAGVADPWQGVGEPTDDGIWWMDLESGGHRLILSVADMAALRRRPSMDRATHRFNHLVYSPDDNRFVFLHRWRPVAARRPSAARRVAGAVRGLGRLVAGHDDYAGLSPAARFAAGIGGLQRVTSRHYGAGDPGLTRLATAAIDGSDVNLLADEDMFSHFDWRDSGHILAWARRDGQDAFYVFNCATGAASFVDPEAMPRDGHCSYSPDPERRFILNDTLPDRENRIDLYVYDTWTRRRIDLGRFFSPPELINDFRCDLHPRWSRDGRQVCFDSAHEGSRQLYVLELTALEGA